MLDTKERFCIDDVPFGEEARFLTKIPSDSASEPIPDNLDVVKPGPVLAGWLASIDVSAVSPFDRTVVLKAHNRMASHYRAQMYRDMAAIADGEADLRGQDMPLHTTDEAAGAEVGVALRLTRRGADIEMAFALGLFRRLPRLARMLEAGIVDVARAKLIERATGHLTDAASQDVLDSIADSAGDLTTGELRARLRRLCIEADVDDAKTRYVSAIEERKIIIEATESGTVHLVGSDLPPERVQAITRRINTIARGLRRKGESRSMDQLRADVYLDLLNGVNHHTVGRGVVDITVDLATLTGLVDHPGELGGYGPVIADIARHVSEEQIDAEWRITITDPDSGDPIALGVTQRRPSASQRRRVEARHPMCVFPGCRMPARQSDIDHIQAVQDGGGTNDDNLAPLCRHHHRLKHTHGWTYGRINGSVQWTSPTGHTYTNARPPP